MENTISECNSYSIEQDVNHNGVIDDEELTCTQLKYKCEHRGNNKDIIKLFIFIYTITVLFLAFKFFAWRRFGVLIDISSDKLALALNLFIVIVGTAEGLRSFGKTIISESGISAPVPAYKLKYLFNYLIWFAVITIFAVVLEFLSKIIANKQGIPIETIPSFSSDKFLNGVLTNIIAYLIAKFGNKVVENIDLSSFKIFKNKE